MAVVDDPLPEVVATPLLSVPDDPLLDLVDEAEPVLADEELVPEVSEVVPCVEVPVTSRGVDAFHIVPVMSV